MTRFWSILMAFITTAAIAVVASPSAGAATGSIIEELQSSINVSLRANNRPEVNWLNIRSQEEWDAPTGDPDVHVAGMFIDDESEQFARDYPLDTLISLAYTAGVFVQWEMFGVDFDRSSMPAQKQQYCYAGAIVKDYLEANHRGLTDDERASINDTYIVDMPAADMAELHRAQWVGTKFGMSACALAVTRTK